MAMTSPVVSTVHITTLHVLDQDQALDFYCDRLGFEVREDIDLGFMRWLTIALPGDPQPQLLLSLPGGPQVDPQTALQVRDLLTKGALGGIFLTSDDIVQTYETLRDAGVDITQEPLAQPYGTDIGLRDPFGNHVRITQLARVGVTVLEDRREDRLEGQAS